MWIWEAFGFLYLTRFYKLCKQSALLSMKHSIWKLLFVNLRKLPNFKYSSLEPEFSAKLLVTEQVLKYNQFP